MRVDTKTVRRHHSVACGRVWMQRYNNGSCVQVCGSRHTSAIRVRTDTHSCGVISVYTKGCLWIERLLFRQMKLYTYSDVDIEALCETVESHAGGTVQENQVVSEEGGRGGWEH